MSRRNTIAFFALIAAVLLVAYLQRSQPLVTEAGNSAVQETIAAGVAALASALTPSVTPLPTATRTPDPTSTPVATETPLPTYAAQASPPSGIYVIPAVELMPTSDAFDWYACAELAATPSTRERTCEVK